MNGVKVNEFSSSLKEKGASLEISINKVISIVKIAMGEFSGIHGLFNDPDNTLRIVCSSVDQLNSFSKLELTPDRKKLLGVLFIGKSEHNTLGCIFKTDIYETEMNFALYSIEIDDVSQVEEVSKQFNLRFEKIIKQMNLKFQEYDQSKKRSGSNLCMNIPPPKSKIHLEEFSSEMQTKTKKRRGMCAIVPFPNPEQQIIHQVNANKKTYTMDYGSDLHSSGGAEGVVADVPLESDN